ncbi:transcriptional regulator [Serratia marcescens]|jgi:AcrR family transcriptional regulator|uniref:transcriptional regulator CecR n=1 Tax=Serratia TaxID=613 RepID=UPI0004E7305A|nr:MULTISPECIES: transcriptional regulator CecR [Serratia]AVU29538.1 transcriptional regulator [Serratia marcescens]EIV2913103.1 transcriptional regulator CecR [Serratia marcescens]KFF80079.1 transcriptional regulator [Serratia marcescens]MBH2534854.1 transcriptional regulator CecR [Serratia marcescens]MBH2796208.1 transcriptional regulator CecR [Serratia marcescens]
MPASVPHQAAGRARGEQTRRQLLAAATELFGEYGLQGATTRDIAQRAGQNIAAITYYFSSKEGLYLAVAQSLADFIQQAFAPLVAEVDRFRQEPAAQRSPDAALRLLQRGLLAFSELMTQPHTLNLSKIMSREQLAPTEAYPLIHSQVIAPMHERLCRLLSAATGIDEHAPRLVLHTHALIGEVLSFRVARETIRRQAGWQDIGEGEAAQIAAVLSEHIEILVTGLRQRHGA